MKKSEFKILLLIILNLLLVLANFQLADGIIYTIDKSINILDLLSVLVTIVIAFSVPFLVKKAIDDNRGIKSLLIDEFMDLIEIAKKNHSLVSDLFSKNQKITSEHRDKVLENFFDIELKLDSLDGQFSISYPSKADVLNDAQQSYFEYKRFLTDGKFMRSKCENVDYDFYRDAKNAFAKFQKDIMQKIHEIHRF